MRKIVLSLLALLLCVVIVAEAPTASAKEKGPDVNSQKIDLKLLKVDLPTDVRVVRTEDANSAEIKVYDKKTGELLEVYGETIEQDTQRNKLMGVSAQSSEGSYYISTAYKDRVDGPATTRLLLKLNMYSYGQYRQINSVESNTIQVISSGGFTLEDKDVVAISATGSFPTTEVSSNGSGVITYKSTSSESGSIGFSADVFKVAGFNIQYSQSNSKDFYARKFITIDFNFSIYPN